MSIKLNVIGLVKKAASMFLGTVMICGCAIADTSTVDRVDFGKIGLGTPMYTADGVTNEIAKAIAGGGGGADPALYQLATNAYDIATNAYNVTTNVLESKADATFTGIVYLMTTNTRFASYLVSEIPEYRISATSSSFTYSPSKAYEAAYSYYMSRWHVRCVPQKSRWDLRYDTTTLVSVTNVAWNAHTIDFIIPEDKVRDGVSTVSLSLSGMNPAPVIYKKDLPETLNGFYNDTGYVTASITNGLASTNVTNLTSIYSDTPTFSEWKFSDSFYDSYGLVWNYGEKTNEWTFAPGTSLETSFPGTPMDLHVGPIYGLDDVTASRTRTDIIGYTLGNQTDKVLAATNALISASITNGLASTTYVDAATNDLPKSLALITTNDVCNIVTNREVTYSFVANDGTKYEITNYGFTENNATGILNGVSFELEMNTTGGYTEHGFSVTNVPPHGYSVVSDSADVGWPRTPDTWYSGVHIGSDWDHSYNFTKNGIALGLATLTDISTLVPISGGVATNLSVTNLSVPGTLAQGQNVSVSNYGHAEGNSTAANGNYSHAEGLGSKARGSYSYAGGLYADASHYAAFVWSGQKPSSKYESHGTGTFNINPTNGPYGFFLGTNTLPEIINNVLLSTNDVTVIYNTESEEPRSGSRNAEVSCVVTNTVHPIYPVIKDRFMRWSYASSYFTWDVSAKQCLFSVISNGMTVSTAITNINLKLPKYETLMFDTLNSLYPNWETDGETPTP